MCPIQQNQYGFNCWGINRNWDHQLFTFIYGRGTDYSGADKPKALSRTAGQKLILIPDRRSNLDLIIEGFIAIAPTNDKIPDRERLSKI